MKSRCPNMPNQNETIHSLIALCKKNPLLRYVTIKEGYQDSEIYVFRYKQTTSKEGFTNNFWYAFITPDETIIVLGYNTSRRSINYAHCVTYSMQQNAAKLNPPSLFLFGTEGNPFQSIPLEKFLEDLKK